MSTIAERLTALGIVLPKPNVPGANFIPAVQSGNLLFVSGHTPTREGDAVIGKVDVDQSIERGYYGARLTAIEMLATMQDALGSLDRIARFVKVLGFVNVSPGFTQMPAVINGASDLFIEVFGERGRHARSAIGVASLPRNASVELELIAEITQ